MVPMTGACSCAAVHTWAHHHESPNLTVTNTLPGELPNVTNCMQLSPSPSQEILPPVDLMISVHALLLYFFQIQTCQSFIHCLQWRRRLFPLHN